MNILILMMAGSGSRFGAPIPKQFVKLHNKPIFLSIAEHYSELDFIDMICYVSHPEWISKVKEWTSHLNKYQLFVQGGKTRSHSIKNAIDLLSTKCDPSDVILIHDATHPYLDVPALKQVIEAANMYGAATLATFGYDTVYEIDSANFVSSLLPRKKVVNGASPEAFLLSEINRIYHNKTDEYLESMTSAGAIVLSSGKPIKFIQTDILNLKITFQRDFDLYSRLGEAYFFPNGNLKNLDVKIGI